jgi:hypothetical protein
VCACVCVSVCMSKCLISVWVCGGERQRERDGERVCVCVCACTTPAHRCTRRNAQALHTNTHAHTHTNNTHLHTHTRAHARAHSRTHMHIHTRACTHTRIAYADLCHSRRAPLRKKTLSCRSGACSNYLDPIGRNTPSGSPRGPALVPTRTRARSGCNSTLRVGTALRRRSRTSRRGTRRCPAQSRLSGCPARRCCLHTRVAATKLKQTNKQTNKQTKQACARARVCCVRPDARAHTHAR